ncbi:NAD(+) diphosphatase [Roseicitreum antarcticum]|uniref:NAD(+) diphosphatase n=1 Tax=Roseicitreum antarcticum TaxID=564137 RepID=A0A1H2SHU6_9RHOB|nr:NAD(+) diphosphatase [Roseicitreum antarcticum]SDW31065.1 NAD+ diphosphatase [Roseicitreum antarcticum]
MKHAESVTFGGGWADRAAHFRGDPAAQSRLLADSRARILPLWRGKPLVCADERDALGWVSAEAEILGYHRGPLLFLGLHRPGHAAPGLSETDEQIRAGTQSDAHPVFAADVSAWEPDALDRGALAMFADATEQHHPSLPTNQRFAELRAAMTTLPPAEAAMAATARALFNWHLSHRFCAKCGQPSDVTMAGWQRTCPACGAHHFPRTDPVVIMLVTRGNNVLLGRSPGWPEGMYSLLAGFIEPGETMEAAVRREVWEETGVQVGDVGYLASQPWAFPNSLMFGAQADALSDAITLDDELEDALWLTREEMLRVHTGRHPDIRPARSGAIAHFLIDRWLADKLD